MQPQLEILRLTAAELANHYRSRQLSPVEVMTATLRAAEDSQATLNAFVLLDPATALAAARRSEERWRAGTPLSSLDGVPVSVKDNIYAEGAPTRFGSLAIAPADTIGPDSPSVARLREAGALIFGKTTLSDFAHKIVTDSPLTGVTRNPRNLDHTPGGSSGGAAAAVAANLGPIALGTDGGGSIRVPASWTGTFGMKPSMGRVPHHPRGAFAPFSHVGPITRTVLDAARAMTFLSRPDSRDWYALPPDDVDYEASLRRGVAGRRIALSPTLGLPDILIDPQTAAAVERAARTFEELGAHVELADPPGLSECMDVTGVFWLSLSDRLARTLGEGAARLDGSVLTLVEMSRSLPANAFLDAFLRRGELAVPINAFFARYDLLLAPVIQSTAPRLADLDPLNPPRPPLTAWCNLFGIPAASVPCGSSSNGLPIGLQIVAGPWADEAVMSASYAYEQAHAY